MKRIACILPLAIGIICLVTFVLPNHARVDRTLVGEWESEEININGSDPSLGRGRFYAQFTENGICKISVRNTLQPGVPFVYRYTVNLTANPWAIDLTHEDGSGLIKGIFEIEGNALSLCYRTGEGERPAVFGAIEGSNICYYKFSRIKRLK
jgi:uncharacterized protein (TIGR03067 family)